LSKLTIRNLTLAFVIKFVNSIFSLTPTTFFNKASVSVNKRLVSATFISEAYSASLTKIVTLLFLT
jgi:hypothetical protein